ncbi:gustatory receptor 59e [Cochliomyia hominivorax]
MSAHEKQPTSEQKIELQANNDDKNSLFKLFKILRIILQFLCVLPILNKSKMLSIIQQIWCSVILILIWMMSVKSTKHLPEAYTVIEKVLYFCELMFNCTIPLTIYYISFMHKEKLLQIYEKFNCLFLQLRMCRGLDLQSGALIYRQLRREIILLTILIILFYIYCLVIMVLHNNGSEFAVLRTFWSLHVPNLLINCNLGIIWLVLRVISLSYAYLNEILKEFKTNDPWTILPNNSAVNISHPSSSLWYQKEFYSCNLKRSLKSHSIFITLTDISFKLDQLINDVIDIYYVALIMNFVNSFIILTIQTFSVYKYFDSPDVRKLLVFLLKFARHLLHSFNIILILWPNNAIINEKCQTLYTLNSLPVDTLDMEKNVNTFLLQLIVRKNTSSVYNIFDLDLSFIPSIISALSIYVIFLIQIDLGAVTIVERSATYNES